jgi:Protein kinase domain/WD domain, G-beta repeat
MANDIVSKSVGEEARTTVTGAASQGVHEQDTLPPQSAPRDAAIPARFRDYEILEELGGGGMGKVYKAFHTKLKRPVALKVIRAHLALDPSALARFDREMEIVARLDHPNIVRALDAGEAAGTRFLVMELLEGRNVFNLVQQGPLPVAMACAIARQTADALQHIHDHGLVHRDIKPSNLMIMPSGQVKVLDLGIARWNIAATGDNPLTPGCHLIGTHDYLAPEQIDNASTVDGRADIYSLGCTLYHLLAGEAPFARLPLLQKLVAHGTQEPASLLRVRPDLPGALVQVVKKMIVKNKDYRYPTAASVAMALQPFCEAKRAAAVLEQEPHDTSPASRRRSRRLTLWAVLLGALLLLGAAGIFMRVNTAHGTLVLEFPQGIPDNAEVLVDGEKVTLKRMSAGLAEVVVVAGDRAVEVTAGADHWRKDKVTVSRGGKPVLQVALTGQVAQKGAGPGNPTENAQQPAGPLISLTGQTGAVTCIAVSPNGRFAASHGGLGDHSFHLWDLAKNRQVYKVQIECGGLDVLWTPAGDMIVSGGHGDRGAGAVVLHAPQNGKRIGNVINHDRPVRGIALSADGKQLATGDSEGIVRIWEFRTGAKLHEFQHGTGVNHLAFSADGEYLLSACDNKTIRLWNVAQDRQERLFEGHTATVAYVAFSADGRHALSASYSDLGDSDDTVRIWEVATGKEISKLQVGEEGHQLTCAVASRDGRRILTGHQDGSVCLWDLASKKKLATFSKHKGRVQSLAFAPDGRLGLSGENWQGQSDIWLYRLPD